MNEYKRNKVISESEIEDLRERAKSVWEEKPEEAERAKRFENIFINLCIADKKAHVFRAVIEKLIENPKITKILEEEAQEQEREALKRREMN